jgi:peptidoglycan/xylan/chitin deacetylase (PgdA/CDA1 family)
VWDRAFDRFVQCTNRHFKVIASPEDGLPGSAGGRQSVCLTFDDGYCVLPRAAEARRGLSS